MRTLIATLAAAMAFSTVPLVGNAASGVEVGWLDCVAEGGVGFVLGSTKEVRCTYTPADKSLPPETYGGSISKFGVDVGVTGATVMQWAVVAAKADAYQPGSLEGNYVGVTGEATVAAGVGANALVGGSGKGFTLQPVSTTQQAGLNFALGVANFELRKTAG
ncbi:DUF992 domain-containing protein [Arvimicrobium flavum]|uniref:DUF992 domain-containing protein n=1 Tax=Arvimicrobium flavum TaxID=3393320 RepID=UPI00237A9211|nr:DUF992 domain-containing protein [Mesorhizobium shangrilense]